MTKRFTKLSLVAAFLFLLPGEAQAVLETHWAVTGGPSFNWTVFSDSVEYSWGFEAAYWDFDYGRARGYPVALGLNVGVEFNPRGSLYFAEAQTGGVFVGGSVGPVYDTANGWGWQGSAWANFFAGISLRLRRIDKLRFVPGLFLHFPIWWENSGSLA